MRFIKNWALMLCIGFAFMLVSCEKNEVSRISLSQSTLSLNVGQSDTINTVISFTGDISNHPVSWLIDDKEIISIDELDAVMSSESGKNDLSKTVVVKGLKAGSTKLTIKVGEKLMSCDITVKQTSFNFNQALTSNWGDFYEVGTNNFVMYLLESSLSFDNDGRPTGNGNYIFLDFNVPIMQNVINAANFTLANTGATNTFFPGEVLEIETEQFVVGSFVVTKSEASSTIKLITDGSFSITTKVEGFVVEGDVITEDKEVIHFKYEGALEVTDKREEPVELKPTFTHGRLYHYGVAYEGQASNNFVAYLDTEKFDFNSEEFDGELLMLEFNTALTASDSIPSGTYNMITKLDLESLKPFSLIFGYTSESGDEWGCWYYGEKARKLNTGDIKVSKSGDIYTIDYELLDRIGSKVFGTYTGPLEYIDGTATPSSVSASRVKRSSLTKEFPTKQLRLKKHTSLKL